MSDRYQEWFQQADYDMETAEAMYNSQRYIYAVFMCHLSLEKALKGLYNKVLGEIPPKTHNLIFLLNKLDRKPEPALALFITKLNTASIATRYPDELAKIQKVYTAKVTQEMIDKSKEVLKWVKKQL